MSDGVDSGIIHPSREIQEKEQVDEEGSDGMLRRSNSGSDVDKLRLRLHVCRVYLRRDRRSWVIWGQSLAEMICSKSSVYRGTLKPLKGRSPTRERTEDIA